MPPKQYSLVKSGRLHVSIDVPRTSRPHLLRPKDGEMELPEEVRDAFRRHGRAGGRARAARMTAARRKQVARRAATARWVRERFGAASFEALGLPGGDVVDAGLDDLAAGEASDESLAVSLAAPRLRREGVPVTTPLENPEERLYASLETANPGLAHARYGAWVRLMVSFADACRSARIDPD